jgi:hypothetical protein
MFLIILNSLHQYSNKPGSKGVEVYLGKFWGARNALTEQSTVDDIYIYKNHFTLQFLQP